MQEKKISLSQLEEFKEIISHTNGNAYMDIIRDFVLFDPFDGHPFYLFSVIKKENNERFHQPRLTKPYPVPGTTLVRLYPKQPERMKICWTLPIEENFNLFKYGMALADRSVYEFIELYLKNPKELMEKETDDVTDEKGRELYAKLRKRIGDMKKKEKK